MRHVDPRRPRGVLYRAYVRLAGSRPALWFSRGVLWKLDPYVLRWTRGRLGAGLWLPTGLLETTGARTGEARANGIIYFHDGDRVTIVASKAGAPEHPAWFHNLRAHPDVRFAGEPFRAEVITDEVERARLWQLADAILPAFARYREAAGSAGRTIPIVQLLPRV